jgi:hypothetical protein
MKEQFEGEIAELAAPVDDPVYIGLAGKYMGAILYDYETRASWKLYRITAIQFARSYTRNRPSCWEATCEPVYHDAQTGHCTGGSFSGGVMAPPREYNNKNKTQKYTDYDACGVVSLPRHWSPPLGPVPGGLGQSDG